MRKIVKSMMVCVLAVATVMVPQVASAQEAPVSTAPDGQYRPTGKGYMVSVAGREYWFGAQHQYSNQIEQIPPTDDWGKVTYQIRNYVWFDYLAPYLDSDNTVIPLCDSGSGSMNEVIGCGMVLGDYDPGAWNVNFAGNPDQYEASVQHPKLWERDGGDYNLTEEQTALVTSLFSKEPSANSRAAVAALVALNYGQGDDVEPAVNQLFAEHPAVKQLATTYVYLARNWNIGDIVTNVGKVSTFTHNNATLLRHDQVSITLYGRNIPGIMGGAEYWDNGSPYVSMFLTSATSNSRFSAMPKLSWDNDSSFYNVEWADYYSDCLAAQLHSATDAHATMINNQCGTPRSFSGQALSTQPQILPDPSPVDRPIQPELKDKLQCGEEFKGVPEFDDNVRTSREWTKIVTDTEVIYTYTLSSPYQVFPDGTKSVEYHYDRWGDCPTTPPDTPKDNDYHNPQPPTVATQPTCSQDGTLTIPTKDSDLIAYRQTWLPDGTLHVKAEPLVPHLSMDGVYEWDFSNMKATGCTTALPVAGNHTILAVTITVITLIGIALVALATRRDK